VTGILTSAKTMLTAHHATLSPKHLTHDPSHLQRGLGIDSPSRNKEMRDLFALAICLPYSNTLCLSSDVTSLDLTIRLPGRGSTF
jgi:hypothetical protein